MRCRRGRIILRRPSSASSAAGVGLLRLETLDDACPLILNSDAHARFRRGRASVCEIARLTDRYSYVWSAHNYRGELSFYLENKRAFVRARVCGRGGCTRWRRAYKQRRVALNELGYDFGFIPRYLSAQCEN